MEDSGRRHDPANLLSGKEIPDTHRKRRADFGVSEKCEVSCPCWKQNHDHIYIYILHYQSNTTNFIIILEIFGQHVSTPIESSSGPSRIRSKIK